MGDPRQAGVREQGSYDVQHLPRREVRVDHRARVEQLSLGQPADHLPPDDQPVVYIGCAARADPRVRFGQDPLSAPSGACIQRLCAILAKVQATIGARKQRSKVLRRELRGHRRQALGVQHRWPGPERLRDLHPRRALGGPLRHHGAEQGARRDRQVQPVHLSRPAAHIRRTPAQRLKHHHAHGVDVRSGAGTFAALQLWRRVSRREAAAAPSSVTREAEVQDDGRTVRGHEDVGGLQITMNQPRKMNADEVDHQRREGRAQLLPCPRSGKTERVSLDHIHDQKRRPAGRGGAGGSVHREGPDILIFIRSGIHPAGEGGRLKSITHSHDARKPREAKRHHLTLNTLPCVYTGERQLLDGDRLPAQRVDRPKHKAKGPSPQNPLATVTALKKCQKALR